ncbi:MAG: F0F1 ATP synthase subunit delta [Bacillota bacterium]
MSSLVIAKRYGQALFELASERNILGQMKQEMANVLDVIEQNEELKKMTKHKLISIEVKQKVFLEIFQNRVSELTLNFLLLVLQKKRESMLDKIVEHFINLANEASGIVKAYVKSAVKLSPAQLESLRRKLEEMTGKRVLLEVKIDHNIMGGLVVQIGDTIIDGSVLNKLRLLEKHLKSVEFVQE